MVRGFQRSGAPPQRHHSERHPPPPPYTSLFFTSQSGQEIDVKSVGGAEESTAGTMTYSDSIQDIPVLIPPPLPPFPFQTYLVGVGS